MNLICLDRVDTIYFIIIIIIIIIIIFVFITRKTMVKYIRRK